MAGGQLGRAFAQSFKPLLGLQLVMEKNKLELAKKELKIKEDTAKLQEDLMRQEMDKRKLEMQTQKMQREAQQTINYMSGLAHQQGYKKGIMQSINWPNFASEAGVDAGALLQTLEQRANPPDPLAEFREKENYKSLLRRLEERDKKPDAEKILDEIHSQAVNMVDLPDPMGGRKFKRVHFGGLIRGFGLDPDISDADLRKFAIEINENEVFRSMAGMDPKLNDLYKGWLRESTLNAKVVELYTKHIQNAENMPRLNELKRMIETETVLFPEQKQLLLKLIARTSK